MSARRHVPALLLALVVGLAGCRDRHATTHGHDHDDDDHAHHDDHGHTGEAEGDAPVTFKEGRGLQLAEVTAAALGIVTADVEEREVRPTRAVTATVFDSGPPARASAFVPAEVAGALARGGATETGARVLEAHREVTTALGQVEVVIELPGTPTVGTTVNLALPENPRTVTAVTRAALLRTATGTFVYVVNGTYLLRTPVEAGAGDGAFTEIRDGLYAGDVVVTAPVEQLWLTELRLTKGGGHSH